MSEIICNIKNLSLSFGEKEIFRQADFVINRSEKIGPTRLNGKGKSCLMNLLDQKISPDETDPKCDFVKSNTLFNVLHIPQELPLPSDDIKVEDYFFFFFSRIPRAKTKT